MTKQAVPKAMPKNALATTKGQKFMVRLRRDWELHLMILLPMLYIFIFDFGPLYGLQLAFRDYRPRRGIWGSEWVGLKWFIRYLNSAAFKTTFPNTIIISLYGLATGFSIPIVLALFLHVSKKPVLKKLTQNVSYIPHFISTVVMVGILNQILNPVCGIYGVVYRFLGGEGIPNDIRASQGAFRHLYIWSGIWQGMGWSTIIYIAALAGVSPELHEAAQLDGASRLKRVFTVDLPAIMPTIIIKLILSFGGIVSVGYQKIYLMQNDLNIRVSEVISTYIYKVGIAGTKTSYGMAIGLFNSLINTGMLLLVNAIANWLSDGEQGLL